MGPLWAAHIGAASATSAASAAKSANAPMGEGRRKRANRTTDETGTGRSEGETSARCEEERIDERKVKLRDEETSGRAFEARRDAPAIADALTEARGHAAQARGPRRDRGGAVLGATTRNQTTQIRTGGDVKKKTRTKR